MTLKSELLSAWISSNAWVVVLLVTLALVGLLKLLWSVKPSGKEKDERTCMPGH